MRDDLRWKKVLPPFTTGDKGEQEKMKDTMME
jgi:hypothetical protein